MDMDHTHPSSVWPADEPYTRALVAFGFVTVPAILSIFVFRRGTLNWQELRAWPVVKILVLAVMVDSLAFVWASAILLLGVGSSLNSVACAVGIWWCIFLYATSKVFIYLFLMERVHLVHQHTVAGRISRWRSNWYRGASIFFVLWVGVAISMIVGRISKIRDSDGACIIGLKLYATVPMLIVDFLVNVFLTLAFVIPIYKSKFPKAQRLARNSSMAAMAALITSAINITILAIQYGHQLSWVCLGSCGLDVAFNSTIIFIITRSDRRTSTSETGVTSDKALSARRASLFPPAATPTRGNSFTQDRGVRVSSEVVRTEEVGPEYVPSRSWRGSTSARGAGQTLTVVTLEKDERPLVHDLETGDGSSRSTMDDDEDPLDDRARSRKLSFV